MTLFNKGLPDAAVVGQRKLPIWRGKNLNGMPFLQDAAFKIDIAYPTVPYPIRFRNNVSFVALDTASSTNTSYSADGKTWAVKALPYTQLWRGIAANASGSLCLASGGTNTTQAAYSTNSGLTWNAATLTSPADWGECAVNSVRGVIVTNGVSSVTNYTTNGTSYTAGTTPTSTDKIKVVNDRFYTGLGMYGSYYSADGITWNNVIGGTGLFSLEYANGIYVGSNGSGTIYTSSDGITFTGAYLPFTGSFHDIKHDGSVWVLVDKNATGKVYTSPDLKRWTERKNYDATAGVATARLVSGGPSGLLLQTTMALPLRIQDFDAQEITYLL